MISLAEQSQKNSLFNNDLYISVDNLIELIFNHSNSDKDGVIVYLVQGLFLVKKLSEDSILVHQYTQTIGYHDINHSFFDFLTNDELEPYKFCELEKIFDLTDHYLSRDELAKMEYITKLNIKSLSDFYNDDLSNSINPEGDNDPKLLKKKLSDAEDTILKLKAEIVTLKDEHRKLESVNYNNNTRNQDYKIITLMAILLSRHTPKFKNGKKPNMNAIGLGIITLANDLNIDNDHLHGLKSADKRISNCLEIFSKQFNTGIKSNLK